MSRRFHISFQSKVVFRLQCRYCSRHLCSRGMKANLLADKNIELFSTDFPIASSLQLMEVEFSPKTCNCAIRNVACIGCGNIIGYHVVSPCEPCLTACNNGHFWMFSSSGAICSERLKPNGCEILTWGEVPTLREDLGASVDTDVARILNDLDCCR